MSDAPALPKGILLPLAFVNFTIGAGAFLVIALLAPLTQSLALSKAQAGWVMGAYALAYAISSPIVIALTGAWRRRAVILIGLGLFVAASLASAFATSATTLYAARVVVAVPVGKRHQHPQGVPDGRHLGARDRAIGSVEAPLGDDVAQLAGADAVPDR